MAKMAAIQTVSDGIWPLESEYGRRAGQPHMCSAAQGRDATLEPQGTTDAHHYAFVDTPQAHILPDIVGIGGTRSITAH